MGRARHALTPEVIRTVLAYVRAGGFVDVAAEAAGVPAAVFAGWLRRGEQARAPKACRELLAQVRQAQAEARLGAEARALADRPLDWLKHGPGRPTPDRDGWTGPARARGAGPAGSASPLDSEEFRRALARLVDALAAHPGARAAAADALRPLTSLTPEAPPDPS